MNQGRIWCVVNPTVGLPLFLGSVAVTSLIVHYSVLSNTTWFGSYWNGGTKAKAASAEPSTSPVALNTANGTSLVISVAPQAGAVPNAETSYVITLTPKVAAQTEVAGDAASTTLAMASPAAK
jgi:light-harvesting protein B-800-850 alpha chain